MSVAKLLCWWYPESFRSHLLHPPQRPRNTLAPTFYSARKPSHTCQWRYLYADTAATLTLSWSSYAYDQLSSTPQTQWLSQQVSYPKRRLESTAKMDRARLVSQLRWRMVEEITRRSFAHWMWRLRGKPASLGTVSTPVLNRGKLSLAFKVMIPQEVLFKQTHFCQYK